MVAINPSLIDVERRPDGALARGCTAREDALGADAPVLEDHLTVIPRGEWPELLESAMSLERLVQKIKDQGREGSCTSNAFLQGYEIVTNMTIGLRFWMEMSPMSVYRWVARGPNTGSSIIANLKQLRDVGALPADTPENRRRLELAGMDPEHVLKPTGYYQKFPEGWQETARHFRALEWFDIRTFEGLITALFLNFPVIYGRASHAISGVFPVYENGVWYVKYANSWGPWGEGGFGYDSESFIRGAIPAYGAVALRAVRSPEKLLDVPADVAA